MIGGNKGKIGREADLLSSLVAACLLPEADFRTIYLVSLPPIGTALCIQDAILRVKNSRAVICCWFCTFLCFCYSFVRLKIRLGFFPCFRYASSTQNGRLLHQHQI